MNPEEILLHSMAIQSALIRVTYGIMVKTYGGNSFDLCRYTLMIINYSSQSLEGIIYSYRDFRFDTSEQAIHIVSRDAPFGPIMQLC